MRARSRHPSVGMSDGRVATRIPVAAISGRGVRHRGAHARGWGHVMKVAFPALVEGVVQRTATKYLGREIENATNYDEAACGRYLQTQLRIPFGFDHSLSQTFTGSEDAMRGMLATIQQDLTTKVGSNRPVALAIFDHGRS